MSIKKGLLAGLAIFIFGIAVNFLITYLFPTLTAEYQNTNIFRSWTDPLMTAYFAYPFILGLVLSYFWNLVKDKIKGKNPQDKAMEFAKIYFIIATIPGMFISYTSMQLSLTMILVWTIVGYLEALIAGLVFAKVKK